MASRSLKNTDDLISCPICLERYINPRILPECGHQFCLACLENLDNNTADGFININCPLCRKVTKCKAKQGISSLARPILMNEVQEMLEKQLDPTSAKDLRCDICEKPEPHNFMWFCVDCQDKMCDECYAEHKRIPAMQKHKTFGAHGGAFCDDHGLITMYICQTCTVGLCKVCARKQHKSHLFVSIDDIAIVLRGKLDQFFKTLSEKNANGKDVDAIDAERVNMVSENNRKIATMDASYGLLKSLMSTIRTQRDVMSNARDSNNHKLRVYWHELLMMFDHRVNNLSRVKYLRDEAPSLEVYIDSDEFIKKDYEKKYSEPIYPDLLPVEFPSQYNDVFLAVEKHVNQPSVEVLKSRSPDQTFLQSNLGRINGDEAADSTILTSLISKPSCFDLDSSIQLSEDTVIWDVLFKGGSEEMVFKTNSHQGPIAVFLKDDHRRYDVYSNVSCYKGGDCPGLARFGHLAYDSKRNLHLATSVQEGVIYLVPDDGTASKRLVIPSVTKPVAIDYLKSKDVYVISDSNTPEDKEPLHIYDPKSNKVVKSLTSSNDVISFCSYTDASDRDYVVTCEKARHQISVYDVFNNKLWGNLGYGHGEGIGELCNPSYVTTVSPGKVLVCDAGNERLVSFNIISDPYVFYTDYLDYKSSHLKMTYDAKYPMGLAVSSSSPRRFVLVSGKAANVYVCYD